MPPAHEYELLQERTHIHERTKNDGNSTEGAMKTHPQTGRQAFEGKPWRKYGKKNTEVKKRNAYQKL